MAVTEELDGRRARAARSREAVVEAILELLNELDRRPTVDEVAERAGVSPRSVFRHFDDAESLFAAAVESHARRNARLWQVPTEGETLDARIAALVKARAELYESVSPVRRVAERYRTSSEAIGGNLSAVHRLFRSQLTDLLAPELGELPSTDVEPVLDALEAATSWHSWEQLRREQGCSRQRAERALTRSVAALLRS